MLITTATMDPLPVYQEIKSVSTRHIFIWLLTLMINQVGTHSGKAFSNLESKFLPLTMVLLHLNLVYVHKVNLGSSNDG
jgi:hypothetical protein